MAGRAVQGGLLLGLVYGLTTAVTLLGSLWVYGETATGSWDSLMLVSTVLCMFLFRGISLTEPWRFLRPGSPGTRVLLMWGAFLVAVLLFDLFSGFADDLSRKVLATWLLATPVMMTVVHLFVRHGMLRAFPSIQRRRTAVLIFANDHARRLATELTAEGHELLGFFEDREIERCGGPIGDLPHLGHSRDALAYVQEHNVEVVYIVLPENAMNRAVRLINVLGDSTASIIYVPDWDLFTLMQSQLSDVRGIPILEVIETPFYGVDGALKRVFDVLVASMILILTTPLWLLIAFAVWRSSPGPILFKQRRYGLNGEQITVHKFRSMTVTEDDEELEQAKRDDPRITKVGAFLRRTSLDEWPQFWNVIRGDMSIVGPRPHAVAHNEFYRRAIQGYMSRHKVKPGVTGWAQINGYRGETQTLDRMEKRIELDLEYIRNWSPILDVKIVLMTAIVVFKDENAY